MTTDKSADDAVLDDVFSSERDRGGKSAPSEAAPAERPAEPQAQQPPADTPSQEPQAQDPETGRMVPLSELTSERKKLKGKLDDESRARIAAETEAKLLREQLQRYSQPQPQQPQQRQQVRIPDPVTEPEQYAAFVYQTAQQQVLDERLNASEDRARDKYGDDLVDEAFRAAQAAGLVGAQSPLLQQRHPWGAMVEWHKQQKVLSEVGTDPTAYAKKIEEQVRAKVLEELKAGNGQQTPGAQPPRFPGTLADATATGQQGAHLTDEAVMGAVFSSNRNRHK